MDGDQIGDGQDIYRGLHDYRALHMIARCLSCLQGAYKIIVTTLLDAITQQQNHA